MNRTDSASRVPLLSVRAERDGEVVAEGVFSKAVVVGRGDEADLRVDDGQVSREHAELAFHAGCWWVRDLGSANGTFVGAKRVVELPLEGPAVIELGRGGPVLYVEEAEAGPGGSWEGAPSGADPSVTQVLGHYFSEGSGPAGERTQLVREAYRRVHRSHRRRVRVIVGAAVVLLAGASAYALWQRAQKEREREHVAELKDLAAALFADMRAQDVEIAGLRSSLGVASDSELDSLVARAEALRQAGVDVSGGIPVGPGVRFDPIELAERIRSAEARRRDIESRYDHFVSELGVYRDATEQERVILKVARVFNESENGVDAGFVQEVMGYVAWWRSRGGIAASVAQAERAGYTPVIVATLEDYGLPPEFFYLALVESHFDPQIVGTPTNYGFAKGMWQFIPDTGIRFGLTPGPLVNERVYDPLDERHDFVKSTDAAARYLLQIYTDLSQASGLLAMASYNWGEGRVIRGLRDLPPLPATATVRDSVEAQLQAQFAGIAQDPQQRSYWRFLNAYRDRMPDETRNYVMRIFSAAVIGQNPRLFGFNFDNPLERHVGRGAAGPAAPAASP